MSHDQHPRVSREERGTASPPPPSATMGAVTATHNPPSALAGRSSKQQHQQITAATKRVVVATKVTRDFSSQVYWYELPIKVSPWTSQEQYEEERQALRAIQDTHGYHVWVTPTEFLPSVVCRAQRDKRYYDKQRAAFRRSIRVEMGMTSLGVVNLLLMHLGRDPVTVPEAKKSVDAVVERYRAAEAAFQPVWDAYHKRHVEDPSTPPPVEPQFLPDAPLLLVLQPLLAARGLRYELRPSRGRGSYDLIPSDLVRGERVAIAIDLEKPALAGFISEPFRQSKYGNDSWIAFFAAACPSTDDRPYWRLVRSVKSISRSETICAFIYSTGRRSWRCSAKFTGCVIYESIEPF